MEIWQSFIAASCAVFVLLLIWRVLNWVWLEPKKLEKCLRQQGFTGNSYRFLFGDLKEYLMMTGEAKSKPINLSDDIVSRVIPFIHQTINNYGKNSFVWLGPIPRVHIMDLELIRDIFVKHYDFQKPTNELVKLLGNGLANHEGVKWVKHRKIINPAFHQEKLKQMLPAFNLSCSEMISKWKKIVSTEESSELDVWPYIQTLTADVISRTAFGSCYEEGRRIFELQKEQAQLVIQALQFDYIPGWRFLPTKRRRRMKAIDKDIEASLRSIIDKKVKKMNAREASKEDDLLGILLEKNFQEIEQHGNKNVGLSIKEIMEECKLFYIAGQETTSVLLVWTMILLSQHPSWQVRAREEVFEVFGKDKPDLDRLNHLKIITMILYEVMRLYPPVIILGRRVFKEVKLGELNLPAGCVVSMPIILIHRNTEIWGDDANDFKPERFSEGLSKATKGQVSFFPFGWGPRICIGQNFALLEAKMALAMILQGFTFELSPSYSHAPYSVITLQPQYGAHLLLTKV